jgi:hypothetical protein
MWKPLFERAGAEIDFAHRTFRWDNETLASEKAHVHCVIVGFHVKDDNGRVERVDHVDFEKTSTRSTCSTRLKTIFDNGKAIPATHIDGYLLDAPDVFIENRSRTRGSASLPNMSKGSQPTDGGNLILSPAERDAILAKWPDAAAFILRYIGADDFINNIVRYCLWLKDVAPNLYRHIPPIMERLARVVEMRRKSPTKSVRRDAETPMLFTQIRQPTTDYLVVPEVSSQRRKYIPIGYLKPDIVASNKLYIIPDASLYLFGVLISIVHMAWMRIVAGRLKSDYSYSPAVYNNFPWPELGGSGKSAASPNERQPIGEAALSPLHAAIESTAQAILDARARYPNSSLADLYDPLTMPPDLRAAHAANDRAVLAAYGLAPDTPEPEIVAHLFRLYQQLTTANR